jgi:hypothetical protein
VRRPTVKLFLAEVDTNALQCPPYKLEVLDEIISFEVARKS